MSIGVDVKSNKEIYMKSFQKNFLLYDSLTTVLDKGNVFGKRFKVLRGVGVSDKTLLKNLIYSLVNYRVFMGGLESVINDSSDKPVDKGFLQNNVSDPLQKYLWLLLLLHL